MAAGNLIRIGLVVQRYGHNVLGGAETLARQAAEKLTARGYDVTVFTTTANDYTTWENQYPPGESLLRGVTIRRYPVVRSRDIESFNRHSETFFATPPEKQDEHGWLHEQGPECPELLEALARDQDRFDLFIFVTYLYYPTVYGLPQLNRPVVFFPTAHDEPPLYLAAVARLFERADALFFLTRAEADLVERVFRPTCPREVLGTGVELDDSADEYRFRSRYGIIAPYILYAGRIERGKGIEPLLDYYRHLRHHDYIDLVMLGRKLMDIPPIEGVRYLGFIPEREKMAAFKGAILSVQPSPVESLSITTLESFSQRTPVLVNRDCPALVEHVTLSGGGFAYSDLQEFLGGFRRIYKSSGVRSRMGDAGYEYVKRHFSWERVLDAVEARIASLIGGSDFQQLPVAKMNDLAE